MGPPDRQVSISLYVCLSHQAVHSLTGGTVLRWHRQDLSSPGAALSSTWCLEPMIWLSDTELLIWFLVRHEACQEHSSSSDKQRKIMPAKVTTFLFCKKISFYIILKVIAHH